jgi:hypothetical protein
MAGKSPWRSRKQYKTKLSVVGGQPAILVENDTAAYLGDSEVQIDQIDEEQIAAMEEARGRPLKAISPKSSKWFKANMARIFSDLAV